MSFQYERDNANRRIVVTFLGPFNAAEARAVFERHRAEDGGSCSIFYDLQQMTTVPTIEAMQLLMAEDVAYVPPKGRGPIACLAADPFLYTKACMYAVLCRPALKIEVFHDRSEAEDWLASYSGEG